MHGAAIHVSSSIGHSLSMPVAGVENQNFHDRFLSLFKISFIFSSR